MNVGKIFKVLIVIVACVIIGAIVLNVLLPNVMVSMVNAVEGQIFNATGMSFDFNGDGTTGTVGAGTTIQGGNAQMQDKGQNSNTSNQVQGFN